MFGGDGKVVCRKAGNDARKGGIRRHCGSATAVFLRLCLALSSLEKPSRADLRHRQQVLAVR